MATLKSGSLIGLYGPVSSKQLGNLIISALVNCIGTDA